MIERVTGNLKHYAVGAFYNKGVEKSKTAEGNGDTT